MFFTEAYDYVSSAAWPPGVRRMQPMDQGTAFDYRSIMIYSSRDGSADADNEDITKSIVLIDTRDEAKAYGGMIDIGGNPDPRKASISALDIERVKQLYPRQGGSSKREASATIPKHWAPVKVVRMDTQTRVMLALVLTDADLLQLHYYDQHCTCGDTDRLARRAPFQAVADRLH